MTKANIINVKRVLNTIVEQICTSCKKIEVISSNIKEHIKWVVCGATVFLLFWLHQDSQSFKILSNFYLPYPAVLFLVSGDVKKP